MIYPPPPGLAFLAYQFGKISKAELKWCLNEWHEKHERKGGEMVDDLGIL